MTTDHTRLPDFLVDYLTQREQQHAEAVNAFLDILTDYERGLIHDAAVMGYVRGSMHPQGEDIPRDKAIIADVINACFAHSDLYPYVNADFEERRITVEYFVQCQQPDGSWEQASGTTTDPGAVVERCAAKRRMFPDFVFRIARRTTRVIVEVERDGDPS